MSKISRRRALGLGASAVAAAGIGGAFGFNVIRGSRPCPNVVFVVSDALRPDRLGCYGYRRETPGGAMTLTPNIDKLAEEGIVFDRCLAPSSWTLPSVTAIMSSRLPFVEGDMYNEGFVKQGCKTCAQLLKGKGYETLGLVKNPWLYKKTATTKRDIVAARGFDRYFQGYMTFADNPLHEKGIGEPQVFERFTDAAAATQQAVTVLSQLERPGGPFFLYLHYMDTHEPYNPPDDFKAAFCKTAPVDGIPDHMLFQAIRAFAKKRGEEALADSDAALFERALELYDCSVSYVDGWIGKLVSHLKESGLWDSTLFILSSDHGEEFAEHGWIGHSTTLYDESLRVPLVVAGRGVTPATGVLSPVRSLDIVPTILASCDIEVPDTMCGMPLDLSGRENNAPARSVATLVRPDGPGPIAEKKYAVCDPRGMKFIRSEYQGEKQGTGPLDELYDLNTDAAEKRNLAALKPEVTAALQAELDLVKRITASDRAESLQLDDETRRILKSIGYL